MPRHLPRQRLKNLVVKEVSLVDDGDNPGARFSLYKARGDEPTSEEQASYGKAFHIPGQAQSAADCPPGWRFVADRNVCVRVEARRIRKLTERTERQESGGLRPHEHALQLPNGAIAAGTFRTDPGGADDHDHDLVLGSDLRPGQTVMVETGPSNTELQEGEAPHSHRVEITAVESAINPSRPGATDVAAQRGEDDGPSQARTRRERERERRRRRRLGPRSRQASQTGFIPTGRQLLEQRRGPKGRVQMFDKILRVVKEWAGKEPDEELRKRLFDEVRADAQQHEVAEVLLSRLGDLAVAVKETIFDTESDDPQADIAQSVEQFAGSVDGDLADIFAGRILKEFDELDAVPDAEECQAIIQKVLEPLAEDAGTNKEEGMDLSKLSQEDRTAVEAALEAAGTVKDLTEKVETQTAEIAKLQKSGEGEGEKDPLEGVPAEVRKVVDPMLKAASDRHDELAKENTTLKERLDKIESDAAHAAFEKSVGDLTGIPQKREEVVAMLWGMPDAEARSTMQKNLEAAAEAARRGNLYAEIGTGLEGGGSAYAQITSVAEEIRKANPELTEEAARGQAMQRHPELYDAYLAEQN